MKKLRLLLPDIDNNGSLSTWEFHALDAKYWFVLFWTLKHLSIQTPENSPDGQENDVEETRSDPPSPPHLSIVKLLLHNLQKCSDRLHDLPLLKR